MTQMLAIAAGGALGALLRYWASNGVHLFFGRGFPYGTLVVNAVGSLLMGYLYITLLDRWSAGPASRAFLLIGLLGAFTTFSTFSLETLNLIESGHVTKAALNIVLSVVICLGAAALGILGGRQV